MRWFSILQKKNATAVFCKKFFLVKCSRHTIDFMIYKRVCIFDWEFSEFLRKWSVEFSLLMVFFSLTLLFFWLSVFNFAQFFIFHIFFRFFSVVTSFQFILNQFWLTLNKLWFDQLLINLAPLSNVNAPIVQIGPTSSNVIHKKWQCVETVWHLAHDTISSKIY